jgi:hypothetical protein
MRFWPNSGKYEKMAANMPEVGEFHRKDPPMKQMVVGLMFLVLTAAPSVFAQEHDHGEIGVYGDYFRLGAAGNADYLGVGGRIGFNVAPRVQLEAQMAYDFEKSFTTITSNLISTTVQNTSVTLLHGLFGPKFSLGTDHARLFGTVQGGFIRFGVSNGSPGNGFLSSVGNFGDTNTNAAIYPGGGGEFSVGPIGVRIDVGDFIYFNAGAHNNLVVKFGPQIKF